MQGIETDKIRRAVLEKKVIIRLHAHRRMFERKIFYEEVLDVILHGNLIEHYPKTEPCPAYLFMGFVREEEPLYVLCGFDGEMVYIITVHWLDPERWIDPWTRRRR